MKRRDFLKHSSLAGGAMLAGPSAAALAQEPVREFYELRTYEMQTGNRKAVLHDYLEKACLPAWNRLGIKPVGVFTVLSGANALSLYVLVPHPELASLVARAAGWRRRVPESGGAVPVGLHRQPGLRALRDDAPARLPAGAARARAG
jgi:hypothetical protein